MITFEKNNILETHAEVLVNSVNLLGVMGKGVALAFREAFPINYELYKKACNTKQIDVGRIFVTETGELFPKYIINFPTKKDWRHPSKYEYIEKGLQSLVKWLNGNNVKSIAIPPLGSGNGKLDWSVVKNMILKYLQPFENQLNIIIIEPSSQFDTQIIQVQANPHLTPARAMLLYLMEKYTVLGYEITLLVVQKLAYFLQLFGEPLKLRYEKGHYGPYASNLLPVLSVLNHHYIDYKNGGTTKPSTVIQLSTEKISEINSYIEKNLNEDQIQRLEKIIELVRDFETPFSMELLGTVDYILRQNNRLMSPEEIKSDLKNWTQRKEILFKLPYIEVAIKRLVNFFDYESIVC